MKNFSKEKISRVEKNKIDAKLGVGHLIHKAKKSLGQNFLNNNHIAQQIVTSANLTNEDSVLEVGPGKGVLTLKLLSVAGKVVAVEKDDLLVTLLQEKFQKEIVAGKLTLVHDDILTCNLDSYKLKSSAYKLIANIPYYITGLLFRKFLEEGPQPSEIIVMVQKEVAERVLARDGKESLLSMSIKVFGTPSIILKVGRGNFTPAPTVDSAVLKISDISKIFFKNIDEKAFFALLRTGFAHKRKHLLSNLLDLRTKTREELGVIFSRLNLLPTARPENLTVGEWRDLALEVL